MDPSDDWETASTVSAQTDRSTQSSTVYDEGDVVGKFFSRVRHNRSKEVEQMLDSAAVTVEQRGENGMTPLMAACLNGHKRTVKALLKRFAEVNAQDDEGRTALHLCYRYGHRELAEYLVSKGADDTLKDQQGKTCYGELAAAKAAQSIAEEPVPSSGPHIAGYSLEQVAAAAAQVARNTGAGATQPAVWDPSRDGMGGDISWQPNLPKGVSVDPSMLTVNTGGPVDQSPSAALSLSPASSPESWSSLKANVSVGGSQREPSFMQNLDDMVLMEKQRQRAAKSGRPPQIPSPSQQPSPQSFSGGGGYPAPQQDGGFMSVNGMPPPSVGPGGMGMFGGGAPGGFQGGFMSGAGPPMSVNDASPRASSRPPKSSKPKTKRAPLPMCAEGENESQEATMMTICVDQQPTPPASLDQMPTREDLAAAASMAAPLAAPESSSFLDLEGVGNALNEVQTGPPPVVIAPQLFNIASAGVVSPTPTVASTVSQNSADSIISSDSEADD